ncbi:MAG: type II secretion system F family protein [bacterium]|nr:type II secretion system F family protein [bacterium]
MLFNYKAIDANGRETEGSIDALNVDVAISSLQRRGLVVSQVKENDKKTFLERDFALFESVSNRDIVILSRQIATLFGAQVSALRAFRMLSAETPNRTLAKNLAEVTDDLQAGSAISKALSKHPRAFSPFYVNMVRSGEESGKLNEVFLYLADYLDRNYEITSKAKNALIYPAFVIFTFVAVMVLMLTLVIPKISQILVESGQVIPLYTQIVIFISNFFVNYGIFLLVLLILFGFVIYRFAQSPRGSLSLSAFKLSVPYVGDLYHKLYLARITDNLSTMLSSGIPIVRAMEITSDVVDNKIYQDILKEASERVRAGSALSDSLPRSKEIPGVVVQMIKIGEESGELDAILKTLAKFYDREVTNAVDTLVDLIEPVMIVALGLGVGTLLASVLIPIYNITNNIS